MNPRNHTVRPERATPTTVRLGAAAQLSTLRKDRARLEQAYAERQLDAEMGRERAGDQAAELEQQLEFNRRETERLALLVTTATTREKRDLEKRLQKELNELKAHLPGLQEEVARAIEQSALLHAQAEQADLAQLEARARLNELKTALHGLTRDGRYNVPPSSWDLPTDPEQAARVFSATMRQRTRARLKDTAPPAWRAISAAARALQAQVVGPAPPEPNAQTMDGLG